MAENNILEKVLESAKVLSGDSSGDGILGKVMSLFGGGQSAPQEEDDPTQDPPQEDHHSILTGLLDTLEGSMDSEKHGQAKAIIEEVKGHPELIDMALSKFKSLMGH